MKKLLLVFSIIGLAVAASFAQTNTFLAKLKQDDVPDAIIKAIAKDFPETKVSEYFGMPVTLLEDRLFVYADENSDQNFDTYIINFTAKNGTLRATYDKGGNLLSKSEVMKDVRLPQPVELSIAKNFPGWTMAGDKLMMTSIKQGKDKTHYRVNLTKGDAMEQVIFAANGQVIHGGGKWKESGEKMMHKSKEMKENEG